MADNIDLSSVGDGPLNCNSKYDHLYGLNNVHYNCN